MKSLQKAGLLLFAIFTLASRVCGASADEDVKKVLDTFYSDYYKTYLHTPEKEQSDAKLIKWVKDSRYTSAGFKKALESAVVKARKADPVLGLDSDPILAAQDFPEKGYRAKTVKIEGPKAAATMEGLGSKGFHRGETRQ